MKGLNRESRALLDAARDGDDPSAADRKRIRALCAQARGVAAGAAAATASHAAAGGLVTGTSGASAGAVAGAGAASGASAGIAAGAVTASFGAKLLVSVAVVGAMSAGTVGYVRHEALKRADVETVVAGLAATATAAPKSARPRPRSSRRARRSARPQSIASGRPWALPRPLVPTAPPAARLDTSVGRSPAVAEAAQERPSPNAGPAYPPPPRSNLDIELALLQEVHGALQEATGRARFASSTSTRAASRTARSPKRAKLRASSRFDKWGGLTKRATWPLVSSASIPALCSHHASRARSTPSPRRFDHRPRPRWPLIQASRCCRAPIGALPGSKRVASRKEISPWLEPLFFAR